MEDAADLFACGVDCAREDARDAARYRWLRAGSNHGPATAVQVMDGPYFNRAIAGEKLDTAIDAAMSREQSGGGE